MVEPATITTAFAVIKVAHQAFKTIQREPGKDLRAALRAFEDLRDHPTDEQSLQLARQHFHAAEDEEEGYFKALALMGSALCLNATGNPKPAARRIEELLALEAKVNTKVLVKETAKFVGKGAIIGYSGLGLFKAAKALYEGGPTQAVMAATKAAVDAAGEADKLANAEINLLTKLQALVRESGSNPRKLAELLETADLSAL